MGFFGYQFVNLSKEQVATRRLALDQHAQIAQLSQLIVLLGLSAIKFGSTLAYQWTAGSTEDVPSSPQKKYINESRETSFVSKLTAKSRILIWKLDDEVVRGLGTWGQWIGGLMWACWLAILCVQGSAPDYMHLTKNFGLVAASQLPLHYLLAMKSPYSPVQLLLRTSHESLNPAHQVLGRVIMLFLFLHAGFYLNFFIRTGFWVNRFKDLDVILGLLSISIVALIGSTAMGFVRRWNYRLFFFIHAVAPIILMSLLYFHVHHIRVYVVEAMVVALANVALRIWSSKSVPAEVARIPDSNLVRMSLQSHSSKRTWAAGNHVYIRHNTGPLSYFHTNPFTISTLSKETEKVELIAKVLRGNTQKIASLLAGDTDDNKITPTTMSLEGPYGHSTYPPNFERFEKILFVAGGVGATFILPLWRHVLDTRTRQSLRHQDVKLIWSVKQLEDVVWAFDTNDSQQQPFGLDEREIYVTSGEVRDVNGDTSIEMNSATSNTKTASIPKDESFSLSHGRPDLRQAVDDLLAGTSGQVAVFVCGPSGLGCVMRQHVGRWISKNRDIYWHAEEFGY